MRWRSLLLCASSLGICACGSSDDSAGGSPVGGADASTASDGGTSTTKLTSGDGGATDGNDGSATTNGDDGSTSTGRDGGASGDDGSDGAVVLTPNDASVGGDGHAIVRLPDGHWHRIAATAGATLEDTSATLDALSAGTDSYAALSPDGKSLALVTTRFGCASNACLAVAAIDASSGAAVTTNGQPIVPTGRSATTGNVAVYPNSGGPHSWDLYSVTRASSSAAWGAPVLLTGTMAHPFAHDPFISADGTHVVFECGPTEYQAGGTSICEATTDGASLSEIVHPTDGPGGTMANETHHPSIAPDGSIVFEADWDPSNPSSMDETIWRFTGSGAPTLITPTTMTDDNSPCVLPNGNIVSLWLGRVGNPQGDHELKLMQPDGTMITMLIENVDIVDVGTGCGG